MKDISLRIDIVKGVEKMKKVLYMHTGSGNHGCEALVRTTATLLGGPDDVELWSLTKKEDIKYGSASDVSYVYESEQIDRFSLSYFESLIRRKILHETDANQKIFIKKLFKNKIAVSIGGDNYCYPWSAKEAVFLDKLIRKYCKKNILWGCSIDPEALTQEVKDDLYGFDLITARESLTFEKLKSINPNTYLVADSAFLLESENLPLPNNFIEKNTVGINVSPLIMKYGTEDSLILENFERMIEYIIEETNMNICFIPHVVWSYNDDRIPCQYLYDKYKHTNRVCMIEDANCKQLKGYISRCRFIVAARTHASIAAYSTYVPTLVIGYSIKSKGIAKDLFGTYDNYVLPVQELKNIMDLKEKFQWLMQHEIDQVNQLKKIMPVYKQRAIEAKIKVESLINKELTER